MDIISFGLASKVSKAIEALIGNSKLTIPSGTTAERPALTAGDKAIRFNTDISGLEEWDGTEWKNISNTISAFALKGTDTAANILAMAGMVAEDLWIASDTLDGYVYDGSVWINLGSLKGDTGATGNGIASVALTNTVGNTKTYTITFTDTSTTTFDVTNGLNGTNGVDGQDVDHVSKTSGTGTAGTTDTYTVWLDAGETVSAGTFNVYNGADGLGAGDMLKATYDTNNSGKVDDAEKVNGLTVETAVPSGAVFTDTVYNPAATEALTNKTIDNILNTIGADHIHYKVRNSTGSTINVGTVVYASGTQPGTDYVLIEPVTDPQAQVAIGIVHTTLLNNDIGLVVNTGVKDGVNTNAFTVGTILYPNTTGGFTSTKPTSGMYQACAYVLRQHSSSGTLLCEFSEPKMIASATQMGYMTTAYASKLDAITGTNTGDQDLSGYSLTSHNHTGTYEPADATILKDADIGSTVQGYDANTTTAGNTFNGVSQLVKLDGTGKLPAIDGSQLTNMPVALPSQTGFAGKYLKTDGTDATWESASTGSVIGYEQNFLLMGA